MVYDGCNCYFSFWVIFCPFTPPPPPHPRPLSINPKNENFKKMKKGKKHLEISFYTSVPKIMIICCTVPEIWCVTDVIIVHFGLFFALLTPSNSLKNQNFKKMKKTLKISSFCICVLKMMIR